MEITVTSKAAGRPLHQLGRKMSAGLAGALIRIPRRAETYKLKQTGFWSYSSAVQEIQVVKTSFAALYLDSFNKPERLFEVGKLSKDSHVELTFRKLCTITPVSLNASLPMLTWQFNLHRHPSARNVFTKVFSFLSEQLLSICISLASQPYFSAYAHARFARACAYAEKYGLLARLNLYVFPFMQTCQNLLHSCLCVGKQTTFIFRKRDRAGGVMHF